MPRRWAIPLIVRPAYTLGGTGGGIAHNDEELKEIAALGLAGQPACISASLRSAWRAIRKSNLKCCGTARATASPSAAWKISTQWASIRATASSQPRRRRLRDKEYQMLRSAAIRIINALGIEGGCNVQYALDTESMQYYLIEVNPRVSRSSALASKATGYPIAKIAAKIAIGYGLDEIVNGVTGKTYACFEPTIDYVVMKFPRWPFDKFTTADKALGTKMKATGEVMAIGWNFEGALLKAVRSLELGMDSMESKFVVNLDTGAAHEADCSAG